MAKTNTAKISSQQVNAATLGVVNQVVEALLDSKGKEINVLDVRKVFDLSDYFVIASGRSDRHVRGLANRIVQTLNETYNIKPITLEGYEVGHWILLDYSDIVIHIFHEQEREHYGLDSLWLEAKKVNLVQKLSKTKKDQARKEQRVAA